jgi:hypothetical protein
VTFSDFGPKGPGAFITEGTVTTRPLSARVQLGADGLPTQASLSAVAQELEVLEDAPYGSVRLAYFKTTSAEAAALDSWIRQTSLQSDQGHAGEFILFGRSCGNYAREGMRQVRWGVPRGPDVVFPNLDFFVFRRFADAIYVPKATVTTEITSVRLKEPEP